MAAQPRKLQRYYVMFPSRISLGEARGWLKKWGADEEAQTGPESLVDDQLCLAVESDSGLPDRIHELPGVTIHDNEYRAELYGQ